MSDFDRAREWRISNRYTKRLLSEKTGFSVSSIDAFENGVQRGSGEPIDAAAFRRYRLCCAAIAAGLDTTFDW